jgi:hypothetical protein
MITTRKLLMPACLSLIVLLTVLLAGCGLKGPPTMRSFAKPVAVADIAAAYRDGRVDITWSYTSQDKNVIIKGFYLDRAEGRAPYEMIASLPADARQYSDSNIRVNLEYRYKIRVFSGRGTISDDAQELKVMPVEPPPPPQELSYRIINDSVEISWEKAAEGVLFNVYRSSEKGMYPVIPANEKPLEKPFFRDRLNTRQKVYYSVAALIQTTIPNEGSLSSEIVTDPQGLVPAAPAVVRYVRSDYRGYLSWKDSEEAWVTGYKVYRKRGSGEFEAIAAVGVPVFLDEDRVSEETSYYITAVGPVMESLPSATVKVIP